jgi:hypothetical protein
MARWKCPLRRVDQNGRGEFIALVYYWTRTDANERRRYFSKIQLYLVRSLPRLVFVPPSLRWLPRPPRALVLSTDVQSPTNWTSTQC